MTKRLIAAVTAAAVAVSGLAATPAEALGKRERNALKIIAGAAILGAILNEGRKDRAPVPQPQPDPARYRTIPGECVYAVRTSKGLREVVSSSCLTEFGLTRGLPAECAFDIRTSAGTRSVYGPRCLEDFGYRIEDARY